MLKKTEILLISSSINRRKLADLKSIEVMGETLELPAQVKGLWCDSGSGP